MIDPIEQFNIEKLFTIGHIGNQEIAFTNSSAYMFGSVALISLLMIGGVAGRRLVPGRIQSMAEISYEFVANTIRSQRRQGRNEVLSAGVFDVHVHRRIEHDRRHSLRVSRFRATSSSRRRWRCWCSHRADLRVLQERPEILQTVRSVGHSDLHPAAGRVHRGVLVLPAADLALGAPVREHARGPHRTGGVRELHSDAGGPWHCRLRSVPCCRSAW